jgi:hypothetical protein
MFFIKKDYETDDPRREFLVKALSMGAFAATGVYSLLIPSAEASVFGRVPKKMPTGKSIYSMKGDIKINAKAADQNTLIRSEDLVETGDNSEVIFVVGQDAFILRSNSRLKLNGTGYLLKNLRLFTGRMLSVFGRRENRNDSLAVITSTATIGIRGTGVYFESEPDLSYVCTCYGETQLFATADPSSTEQIVSAHHDAPRYIATGGAQGKKIRSAPVINHTDLELMLIEELVGRTTPFPVSEAGYSAPRRSY